MALREEIIKITVDTKQGIVSINGVTTELKKAKAAFADATAAVTQNTGAINQNAAAQTANTAAQTQNSTARQVNYQNTTVSVDRLKQHINFLIKERASLATNSKEYAAYSKQIANANQRLFDITQTGDQITRTNGAMASSAGLAGAATLELGRVFSDINYGIRGIANNVSQFATLFVSLSVSAGGAAKGFAEIVKQIRGPLGILLAIQAAIALIEFLDQKFGFFKKSVDKSAEALESFNQKLAGRQAGVALLEVYKDILEDTTASLEDQQYALEQLKKEGYDKTIGSIDQFIEAQGRLAVMETLTEVFKEQTKDLIKERKELQDKIKEADQKAKRVQEEGFQFGGGIPGTGVPTRFPGMETEVIEGQKTEFEAQIDDLTASIIKKQKELQEALKAEFTDNPFLPALLGGKGTEEPLLPGTLAFFEDLLKKTKELQLKQSDTNEKYQEFEDKIKGINYQIEQIKGVELPDLISEDFEKDLKDALDNLTFKDKDLKLKIPFVYEDFNEVLFNDRIKFLKKFEIKIKDLSLSEQKKRLDEENSQAIDSLNDFYADKLGLEGEDRKRVEEFIAEDIVLQLQYQEEITNIEEFFSMKRRDIANEEEQEKLDARLKSLDSFKETLNSIGGMFDSFAQSRRASEEMRLQAVETSAQKQLANEKLTEEQRNQIRLNAEKQKEQIQKRSIVAEMKYQQTLFALKAAELVANVATDVAEGTIAIKKGTAKTASAGFPKNIPLLIAYAAQAASIVAGMITAKKQAKTALAALGQGGNLGPDPAAGAGAPQFNVVGASELSNLSETIATAEQAGGPIRAYVVLDDIENANSDKFTPQEESKF